MSYPFRHLSEKCLFKNVVVALRTAAAGIALRAGRTLFVLVVLCLCGKLTFQIRNAGGVLSFFVLAVGSGKGHTVLDIGNQLINQFLGQSYVGVLSAELLNIPLSASLSVVFLFLLLGLFGLVAVQFLFQLS